MKNLFAAELLKARTTRSVLAVAAAAVALVPAWIATSILTAGEPGGAPSLETSAGIRQVMSATSAGAVLFLVVGILLMAGERQHGTTTTTYLVAPRRTRVLAAKVVTASIIAALATIASTVLALVIATPWLASRGIDVDLSSGDVIWVVLGGFGATLLYSAIGVGIGALARSQTTAVSIALLWTFVVEGLVVALVPAVGRWLPGGAATSMTAASVFDGDLLPMWGGAGVFLAYGVLFVAGGALMTARRDVV